MSHVTSILLVPNIFIKNLSTTKSNEASSDLTSGQASRPCNLPSRVKSNIYARYRPCVLLLAFLRPVTLNVLILTGNRRTAYSPATDSATARHCALQRFPTRGTLRPILVLSVLLYTGALYSDLSTVPILLLLNDKAIK